MSPLGRSGVSINVFIKISSDIRNREILLPFVDVRVNGARVNSARVNGANCLSYSVHLFCILVFLVLIL